TIGTGVARDVSFSRRFMLELRSYTALEHEAIPRVYELAYDGESPYLVTELVAGDTLDKSMGDGQRYEPLGIVSLLRPIASEVDGRADVYSLAAVIFQATTGRRPFSSKSWIETLSRRLYEPPPNVREVVPDLPAAFAIILQQAMDRDPSRRPASASELLDRLESAITSPNGKAESGTRMKKPAIRVRGVGVGAVLVVIIGAAEAVWLFEGSGLKLLLKVFGAG